MTQTELDLLNARLLELFPVLRDRLRTLCGLDLDAWLERGQSKAVFVSANEDRYISLLDDDEIQEHASELFHLDMEGWDGFSPLAPVTPEECKQIREEALNKIESLIKKRTASSGLKQLIQEIRTGQWDHRPDEKKSAAFFVYGAILGDGQSERLADLWIIEQSPEPHDYIFLLDSGFSVNESWRLCVDVIPSEVIGLLDEESVKLTDS